MTATNNFGSIAEFTLFLFIGLGIAEVLKLIYKAIREDIKRAGK